MQLSPGILGVGAAVLIMGIAGGSALGSVPPMQQRGMHELLPQARDLEFASASSVAWPDHYPLVTRGRRFDVDELGERGLLSQARYSYRAYDEYADYPLVEPEDAAFDAAQASEPEPAVVVVAGLAPDAAGEPVSPDDGAASVAPDDPVVAEVTPRTIDVAVELARRN